MDLHTVLRWVEPLLGIPLMLVVLVDVFLTVLYARLGTAILSERLGRLLWMAFRGASRGASPRRRDGMLAYAGPVIVLTVLAVWVLLLMIGAALVIHPHLGTGVTSSSGETKTDFMTALYAAGNSITLVGSGNFSPQTPAFKAFYIINSFVGMTMISLTLTYLMQIYSALQRRSTLALAVHEASGETGDAADLIGAVGPQRNFSNGYTHLAQLASEALETETLRGSLLLATSKSAMAQARPKPSRPRATAISSVSRRSCSKASSVTVPGVTMRTTLRSTRPLASAGSPICSQMATDSPSATRRAR